MEEGKRVADSLDPSQFAVHVTRVSMLLEELARELKGVRDTLSVNTQTIERIERAQMSGEREWAVARVEIENRIEATKRDIDAVKDNLKWLGRLIVGALISGVIGLVWTFLKH